ncbi:MAG TPA: GNAT family N-acetyltransferase [Jatrophihabitantaceae bacterium]|nr:GNAT family N-acetyltransferase [Jatrophihabitantaceae bacterium]
MAAADAVALRPLVENDLPLVEAWLRQPHLARWWLTASTVDDEIADIRQYLDGEPFEVLMVELDGVPIGWCQWYRWWDDPDEAAELGVGPDDVGIDYGIGEPDVIGRGIGTALIAALVAHVRRHTPAAIVVEPDALNAASRRVLEKNGFELVDVRRLSFEVEENNAIYRLAPQASTSTSRSPMTSRATAYDKPGE